VDDLLNALHALTALLLDFPEEYRLETNKSESGLVIMLYMRKTDISKIIGKSGRNINAIKVLAAAVGAKNGFRVNIIVTE
jgi:predicted RNA-binding protein YlqC (UPF0109 family)